MATPGTTGPPTVWSQLATVAPLGAASLAAAAMRGGLAPREVSATATAPLAATTPSRGPHTPRHGGAALGGPATGATAPTPDGSAGATRRRGATCALPGGGATGRAVADGVRRPHARGGPAEADLAPTFCGVAATTPTVVSSPAPTRAATRTG